MKSFYTLGIETSCDETGSAVYHNTQGLLSNALFSQIELHKKIGGVIPEVASRSQLEKIAPIVSAALDGAGLSLSDIDVVAVTNKPGLAGSLLVGLCFAKAIAWAQQKKIVGVNHMEGHIFSSFLQNNVPFPHICLTASGGHTALFYVTGFGEYELIGHTDDDAAGEAFDKVAKLMDLPYPGGPEIEKRAQLENFTDYYAYPRHNPQSLDFSFSGLKTAVLYDLIKRNLYDMQKKKLLTSDETIKNQVASSLLVCIGDIFSQKLAHALKRYPQAQAVTFVGGVACNNYLRNRLSQVAAAHNLSLYYPSPEFCTDNGAMIAFVGSYKAAQGKFAEWDLDILK